MSVPDHLTAVVRNAHALAARGDLASAQAMLEQALEPAATVLGPDHPDVLTGTRLLASLHRRAGDLTQARRLLEEALAAGQFTLGEGSPTLLPLAYDLALIADELGNRHEARRNFTALLREGPAALGPDHEYVRAARRYLDAHGASATVPGAVPATGKSQPTPPAPSKPAEPAPPRPAEPAPAPIPPSVPAWSPRDGRLADHRPADHHRADHRHSRAPLLILVLVAAMALLAGGVAAYLVLHVQGHTPAAGPKPTATADALQPPGDLRLRDDGSSITLTWTDPTKGAVPFVIAGGRTDNAPNPLGSVESGKTTYTIYGLNTTADYCFLVAAVYSPQNTVPSSLVCTRRAPSTNRPSASPKR